MSRVRRAARGSRDSNQRGLSERAWGLPLPTDSFSGVGTGTYGSPPAGVLVAIAVAGGGLAHEVFVGPIAAQAPVATGTTVGDRLGRKQTGGLGTGLGEVTAGMWVSPLEAQFSERP